jgi:hypothetical protein
MTITIDVISSIANGGSVRSWTHTNGALTDGVAVVAIMDYGETQFTTCSATFNGVSMGAALIIQEGDSNVTTAIFALAVGNLAAGGHTVACTFNGSGATANCACWTLNGVSQTSPVRSFKGAQLHGGTAISLTLDPTVTGDYCICAQANRYNTNPAPVPAAGQTLDYGPAGYYAAGEFAVATDVTQAMSWTFPSSTFISIVAVALKPSAPPIVVSPILMF